MNDLCSCGHDLADHTAEGCWIEGCPCKPQDWEKEFDKLRISYVMVADEDDETYSHSEGTRIIKDFIRALLNKRQP